MAVTLKKFSDSIRKYPWHKWTNGKPWRATKDEDFTCEPNIFRNILYGHAKRKGLSVKVSKKGESVEFQFSLANGSK